MADPRSPWQSRMGVGERQHRLHTVTQADGTRVTQVINESTGRVGGRIIEHRSGRVDSVVTPDPIRVQVCGKSKEIVVK